MILNFKSKSKVKQLLIRHNGKFREIYWYRGWIHYVGTPILQFSYQRPNRGDELATWPVFGEVICVYPIQSMAEFKIIVDNVVSQQQCKFNN